MPTCRFPGSCRAECLCEGKKEAESVGSPRGGRSVLTVRRLGKARAAEKKGAVLSGDPRRGEVQALQGNELILPVAQADVFGMLNLTAPVRGRMDAGEMVMSGVVTLTEDAGGDDGGRVHGVDTGLVQRYEVEAREHADIRHYGGVVFTVTVAAGGDLIYDADVELRASLYHGLGVFGHAAVENAAVGINGVGNGVEVAGGDAAAAAYAHIVVDEGLAVFTERNG